MPLRGKILNVEKANEQRMYENAEITGMITAFGTGSFSILQFQPKLKLQE